MTLIEWSFRRKLKKNGIWCEIVDVYWHIFDLLGDDRYQKFQRVETFRVEILQEILCFLCFEGI